MKFFRKILKNKLFYLVLLLGVFLTPILNFTLQAQEDDFVEVDSTLEFNVIDFTTNELDVDPVTVYNFFRNGFSFNDSVTFLLNDVEYSVTSYTINHLKEYTMEFNVAGETYKITSTPTTLNIYSYIEVDGGDVDNLEGMRFIWYSSLSGTSISGVTFKDIVFTSNNDIYNGLYIRTATSRTLKYYREDDTSITANDDSNVKSEYRKIDFISGNLDNPVLIDTIKNVGRFYDIGKGFDDGDNVKITLRSLIPQSYFNFIDQAQYDAKYNDGYNDGYNQARDDYGYYDEETGKWVKVDERKQVFYDRGYRDGVDDTIDSYNDNGLFIPQSTPKGHLTVEEDLRYGDPYFYLQDFSGNYDGVYFEFQHNRWLEKAFEWAYSIESDFLAFNDIYTIKYKNDEVLYKYFFYRYDTDSIYLYNANGALLKIVERSNFDYSVYEMPELSVEEQDRIDQAYANGYNKAKSEYGYYDTQSDEYLTATEYGEIQYNKGVISISDRAYLDGFYTGMMDSHKYGFDWMRATYSDLIEERPTLQNLRDETSFTHQLAYTQGFNVAREQYGYWNGRVWVTAGSIRDLTYTEAYDLGFRDATNELYDDIHDEIYEIGYRDGQRLGMNNKFYTGLEKWLVPALIVVLFFGFLMLFPRKGED